MGRTRALYVADNGTDFLFIFFVNNFSGNLTLAKPAAVATGSQPFGVAVDPQSRFAYVTNSGSNDISTYRIDQNTASLSPTGTVPWKAGTTPEGIAIDPAGRFLYVTNSGSNDISEYLIAQDGTLTGMEGAPVAAGKKPVALAIHPSGQYLYVANFDDTTVSQYKITPTGTPGGGTLVPIHAAVPADNQPSALVVHKSGKFVYVTNFEAGQNGGTVISVYTVATDGSLTPNGTRDTCMQPTGVVIESSGKYLYVACHGEDSVYGYPIDLNNGTLGNIMVVKTVQKPFAITSLP